MTSHVPPSGLSFVISSIIIIVRPRRELIDFHPPCPSGRISPSHHRHCCPRCLLFCIRHGDVGLSSRNDSCHLMLLLDFDVMGFYFSRWRCWWRPRTRRTPPPPPASPGITSCSDGGGTLRPETSSTPGARFCREQVFVFVFFL